MKRILVPTDFSDYAAKALDYAVGVATATGSEIILMHVCELLHYPFADKAYLVNDYNELKIAELTERLTKLKEQRADSPNTITIKLCDGEIIDSILLAAEQEKVDMIIMGTLGATGLKTVFFGTKTASVLSKSFIPVIAVPFDYEWKKPQTFLLAIRNHEDTGMLEPVYDLAGAFNATLKLAIFSNKAAHADELMEDARSINRSWEEIRKRYPGKNTEFIHLSGTDFFSDLYQCMDSEKIDLLIMFTHQRNLIQELFNFSKTRQMAYHTAVPLLALHSAQPL